MDSERLLSMTLLGAFRGILPALLLVGAGAVASSEPLGTHLQALAEVEYHSLSGVGDTRYHVFVRLPAERETGNTYPTVFLLDGGLTFPLITGVYEYARLEDDLPPMILVGVSYGTHDWRQGNARSRDFTAPSEERDFWGGAEAFGAWMEHDLIPLIESRYPADPQRRILFGQSLGGQFVIHQALRHPTRFRGLIASNPALHRNLPFFLQAGAEPPEQRPRLIVAAGSEDQPLFADPRARWLSHWQAKSSEAPFELLLLPLPGETHGSAAAAAFRRGVRSIVLTTTDR